MSASQWIDKQTAKKEREPEPRSSTKAKRSRATRHYWQTTWRISEGEESSYQEDHEVEEEVVSLGRDRQFSCNPLRLLDLLV